MHGGERPARDLRRAVLRSLAAVFVGAALVGCHRDEGRSEEKEEVPPEEAPEGSSSRPHRTTLAELGSYDPVDWTVLDVQESPGDRAHLDPVAATPWAERVAQAWSADSKMDAMEVVGSRGDGSLDVGSPSTARGHGDSVQWEFSSATKRIAFSGEVATSVEGVTGLLLRLEAGEVRAVTSKSAAVPPADAPTSVCPLPRVLETLRTGGAPFGARYDLLFSARRIGRATRWVWAEHFVAVAAPRRRMIAVGDGCEAIPLQP